MFFQISKTKQDNFPFNHQTENFVISLDEGWSQTSDQHGNAIWYKGYLDAGKLSDNVLIIAEEEEPKHSGTFCVIKVFDGGVIIRGEKSRSFPLWYTVSSGITNLKVGSETIWSDSFVMLDNNLTLIHSKFDAVGPVVESLLTFDEAVDQIDKIIDSKVKSFIAGLTVPLKVFLSGGIDSALVYSYIQKHTDDYELVPNLHIDFDYFYLKNHGYLSKLWGYTQIHHWTNECVLASGAPGDEFTARSPTTANLLLLQHGTSIPELLNKDEFKDCLHYSYYNEQKYLTMWQVQAQNYTPTTLSDTIKTCCEQNLNDWQHWHLGNTQTFTPLRDIELFKLFARLEPSALVGQVMDSRVQRELIRRNNPKILDYLSTQKNYLNCFENLTNLYCTK